MMRLQVKVALAIMESINNKQTIQQLLHYAQPTIQILETEVVILLTIICTNNNRLVFNNKNYIFLYIV